MYLLTANEMREMDRLTIEAFGLPGRILMENAGRGATRCLLNRYGDLIRRQGTVGIVAGRGNNGGDGFVIARYLIQQGISVKIYLLGKKEQVQGDAEANLRLLEPLQADITEMDSPDVFTDLKPEMAHHHLWVDAILGTGLKADVKGLFRDVIEFLNQIDKPIFSVDIPSGLSADTGQPCGISINAHVTATFGFAKIGHLMLPGAIHTGDLEVIDIGIPPHVRDRVQPRHILLTPEILGSAWVPRAPDAHKGNTGHLLVVAGSIGKSGAAAMTAMAAMRAGAGLVTLGVPNRVNPIVETLTVEVMTHPLADTEAGMLGEPAGDQILRLLSGKQALALGPGIGTVPETRRLVHRIIRECQVPLVLDADGINALAGQADILQNAKGPVIITPHPGEMARLVGSSPSKIQEDRIESARQFAVKFDVHVVLKGARTVIAHPNGSIFVNPTGNAGMASGGMGDVLTGMIAGFIAQGYTTETAAHLGVYLHGSGADTLAEQKGPIGFLATEVMDAIPKEIEKAVNRNQTEETGY